MAQSSVLEWLDENRLRAFPLKPSSNFTIPGINSVTLDKLFLDAYFVYHQTKPEKVRLTMIEVIGGIKVILYVTGQPPFIIENVRTSYPLYVRNSIGSLLVLDSALLSLVAEAPVYTTSTTNTTKSTSTTTTSSTTPVPTPNAPVLFGNAPVTTSSTTTPNPNVPQVNWINGPPTPPTATPSRIDTFDGITLTTLNGANSGINWGGAYVVQDSPSSVVIYGFDGIRDYNVGED